MSRSRPQATPPWKVACQLILGIGVMVGLALGLRLVWRQVRSRSLPEGWQTIRPPHEISALLIQDDVVWAGGRDGLFRIDRQSGELLPAQPNTPRLQYVRALLLDDREQLWVAHRGGVHIHSADGWQQLDPQEQWLTPPARALCQDAEGNIWIGTENGAMAYQPANGVTAELSPEELGFSQVDVAFCDASGDVWLGSASATRGGLARYSQGQISRFSSPDPLIHASVNAIMRTEDGTIWIATGFAGRGGAMSFAQGEWRSLTSEDGLAGEKVRSLFEDGQGRLWFGSEYNGLAIRDGDEWRYLSVEDGLADVEVKAILQDTDGVYWLGTADGLSLIEPPIW